MLSKLEKWENHIVNSATIFANIALLLMTLIIAIEIISRSFFDTSTMIADEFAGYFMGMVCFFAALKSFKEGYFVRVEIVFERFRGRFKKLVSLCCHIIMLIYNSFIVYYFGLSVQSAIKFKSISFTIARTPLWIPKFLILLGMILFEIYLIIKIIEEVYKQVEVKAGDFN